MKFFKKNIGIKDRLLRLFLAIVIFASVFFVSSLFSKIILILISIFTLLESLIGWCVFYALIGKNTCLVKFKK